MKRDDVAVVLILVFLLVLKERGKDIAETVKNTAEGVIAGVVTYIVARLLLPRLLLGLTAGAATFGAGALAVGMALWGVPWIKRHVLGKGGDGTSDPLPCSIVLCGGNDNVQRWGINTVNGKRALTAICTNGDIQTVALLEGCQP